MTILTSSEINHVRNRRKPDWIRVKSPLSVGYRQTKNLIHNLKLNTVCEEASCPNIGECWSRGHATVMILGNVCTRKCAFCSVATGRPDRVDLDEPNRLAIAVNSLQLRHVVITSVDRDDLKDGGAGQFADCIEKIHETSPETTIEVLTPDFQRKIGAIEAVIEANPDVYNHNLETVPRLYPKVRKAARYRHSLWLLKRAKELNNDVFTKSGVMVGLGENPKEIETVMDDMRSHDVDFLTIGQYLQPTSSHHPVLRFVSPSEFSEYKSLALSKGFLMVSASPLTRSSYHADADFMALKAARTCAKV